MASKRILILKDGNDIQEDPPPVASKRIRILKEREDDPPPSCSAEATCSHPGCFCGMCMCCGKLLEEDYGITFSYVHKGLRLSIDEIARLRNEDTKNMLREKKLYLILDLDHTLLNSTPLTHITPEEEHVRGRQDAYEGSLFVLEHMRMMTKLRPFVRTFLKKASEMFEMYIYTMGGRSYAHEMAKLLDPNGEYFGSRVISRDDGTQRHRKGLDVVLGQESCVLILDDTEKAWRKHKDNLILIDRYHFFASSCQHFGLSCKSLSQLEMDESEVDGALATSIGVLKQIHTIFFHELEDELAGRNVTRVLKSLRMEVLEGCKIVFNRRMFPNFPAKHKHLWKMAEQLGATCALDLDDSVTHVVATNARTKKSRRAVREKKFLVDPRWVEASYYLWKRQPEESFPVDQKKGRRLLIDEIARLRNQDTINMLRDKKLYLILDLDHTLLNSTPLTDITPEEEHVRGRQDAYEGSLFVLENMRTMTKLRPFVRTFLKKASEIFEMYIYTMGGRSYAHEMAKLLDPNGEYFGSRVISRDDGIQRHQKGLDVVLGRESCVLILDDTEKAWRKHKENLILIDRYHFFASSCRQFGLSCKSLSQLEMDESEVDGALATVIGVLKQIHTIFIHELEDEFAGRNVTRVLKSLRMEVLEGCKIVFDCRTSPNFPVKHKHWKMAGQLGATCALDLDDSVTHVVAKNATTKKSCWAVGEKKFLVGPRWVEASYYLWKRQPEESFPVNQEKKPV